MTRVQLTLLLLLPLATVGAAPSPTTQPSMDEQCQALMKQWSDRFEAENFHVIVSPPYVIAGDGSPADLRRYRDNTVVAAHRALEAMFFEKEPAEPILILLFESEEPYKRLAKQWFGDDDIPHYGFYRHRDRAMLMNVGTGLGTLVHEMTHALIEPDFPSVPDWFNEGFASLFEQSSINGNTIEGLPNWRLPALQKAIRDEKLRSLESLMTEPNFRDTELVGLNYAQSRYLMLYLQEKGLLQKYYSTYRDSFADDPTGVKSLKRVLATDDLATFEVGWRKWVLTLKR